jgi:hypothetical protein
VPVTDQSGVQQALRLQLRSMRRQPLAASAAGVHHYRVLIERTGEAHLLMVAT